MVLITALQKHSVSLTLSSNLSLNSRWGNNTGFRHGPPATCRSAHALPPVSLENEVSSAGFWWQGLHTPRNQHCTLRVNSDAPGTCLPGLIRTVPYGRDTLVNRFGTEVTCCSHTESDFGGKENSFQPPAALLVFKQPEPDMQEILAPL